MHIPEPKISTYVLIMAPVISVSALKSQCIIVLQKWYTCFEWNVFHVFDSCIKLSRTWPPLQLGVAHASGARRHKAERSSNLCQQECLKEKELKRIHKQPTEASEEPDPSSKSGGERFPDYAAQTQIKEAVTPYVRLKPLPCQMLTLTFITTDYARAL